jgi:hypothetical protein
VSENSADILSVVVTGVPQQWELHRGDRLTIGRSAERDIRLNHESVSRAHAILQWTDDEITLEDLNSTNGVFVDNVQVAGRVPFGVGQVAEVGRFKLQLEARGALLPDDSGPLLLFGSEEPLERGTIESAKDVENLLLHMGDLERTGTLVLKLDRSTAELQFYEGQIVSASLGKLSGKAALKLISGTEQLGQWLFYSRVKLVDEAVNISTRRWVNTMRLKRLKRD